MRTGTIILLAVILFSCDGGVRFETPQPEKTSDLKTIPTKLIGLYLNVNDSSTLTVTSGQITKSVSADFAEHKSELDSIDKVTFKNDTSFTQIDQTMRIDVVVKGDSVFQHMDYRDTIFSFNRGDILRKYKGHYFLNQQTSKNNWFVTKLTRTKNYLTLGTVSTKEDIGKLRELTDIKSDTIYDFRPTKKQLKKFIKDKGFSDTDTYIKVN